MPNTRYLHAPLLSLALAACLVTLSVAASQAQEAALGLSERRAIKQYQETKFPEEQKKIQASAKFDVPVEVKWDLIALPEDGKYYLQDDYWTNIYFEPLSTALKGITVDEMGTKAVKDKLKKIVVTYDKATAPLGNYSNGVSFEGGVLTINFKPYTNTQDMAERTKAISDVLGAKL